MDPTPEPSDEDEEDEEEEDDDDMFGGSSKGDGDPAASIFLSVLKLIQTLVIID